MLKAAEWEQWLPQSWQAHRDCAVAPFSHQAGSIQWVHGNVHFHPDPCAYLLPCMCHVCLCTAVNGQLSMSNACSCAVRWDELALVQVTALPVCLNSSVRQHIVSYSPVPESISVSISV